MRGDSSDRRGREITTVIHELEREAETSRFETAAADLQAGLIGDQLAESLSLSDTDVEKLWNDVFADEAAQIDDARAEVDRVLQRASLSKASPWRHDGPHDE